MATPKNYLNKKKEPGQASPNKTRVLHQLPDQTVHHPPGALLGLGVLGVLSGFGGNIWQLLTTFTAFWSMFNPKGTPDDVGKQPAIFSICGLIALSFQLALMMLVFRLDSTWKKHYVSGQTPSSKGVTGHMRATAVEIVQHVNLVVVWGALGFVVDTIGDYTFIGNYTSALDAVTATFLIFIYAVALYALSTVAFVRSIEYIWAGFATADNIARDRRGDQQQKGGEA